jgi:hypothetical protein
VDNTNDGKHSGFFSKKLKAGSRRTYFFDVKNTKQGDYLLSITESKKKFDGNGYESHKIYVYKEDFKNFLASMTEAIDYIKTELLPDYDYDTERADRPATNNHAHRPAKQEPRKEIISHEPNPDISVTAKPPIGDDEQMSWD